MRRMRALSSVLVLTLAACGPAPDPNAAANAKAQQDAAAAADMAKQLEGQLAIELDARARNV